MASSLRNPVDDYGITYPVIPDAPRPLVKVWGPNWMKRPDAAELKRAFTKATSARAKALKAYKAYVEESNRQFYLRKEAGVKRNGLFVPFDRKEELELSELWHISRTALAGTRPTHYDRMLWTSKQWGKKHPGEEMRAYKQIDRTIPRSQWNPESGGAVKNPAIPGINAWTEYEVSTNNGTPTGQIGYKYSPEHELAYAIFPVTVSRGHRVDGWGAGYRRAGYQSGPVVAKVKTIEAALEAVRAHYRKISGKANPTRRKLTGTSKRIYELGEARGVQDYRASNVGIVVHNDTSDIHTMFNHFWERLVSNGEAREGDKSKMYSVFEMGYYDGYRDGGKRRNPDDALTTDSNGVEFHETETPTGELAVTVVCPEEQYATYTELTSQGIEVHGPALEPEVMTELEGVYEGLVEGSTVERTENPRVIKDLSRVPVGAYLAVVHDYRGVLLARFWSRTGEEAAAIGALKAANWKASEISVYKRSKDGSDQWVNLYGKATLDELASKARRQSNPKRKGKRNPETSEDRAADLYESFHGKPSLNVTEYETQEYERTVFAELGTLVQLKVELTTGKLAELNAPDVGSKDEIKLASSPDGKQMFFIGGDQSVTVERLGFGERDIRDHMILGLVCEVTYEAQKHFDGFEDIHYYHELGEETKVKTYFDDFRRKPTLLYCPHDHTLKLAGGLYVIRPEGITN